MNKKYRNKKEEKSIHNGLITESYPSGMFRVRLDNGDLILGYISGKIRRNFIRILPGDRVKIEVSRYDSTRGRIIDRLPNQDSND
uniref:translation initiation factor 1 n=1 Tax=Dicranostigma leptopodum TaxID=56851 RepID=UPI002115B743|nr:translation initiation factor 1 [Dicranostigma leptopodum]USN94280.1 translation initiation factor 1 [Dicranostigma leptopodum]